MQEDVRTILEKFDLLNDGKLNNASVVLFGRNFYHYPQCLLRLARFKGTTKDEFLDNQRVTGNIFNLSLIHILSKHPKYENYPCHRYL